VRVVGDEERAILDALRALRHRYPYVFTTGGIGPTHGDITADCVAKAFDVPIDTDPRALAILHEWVKTTGAEMNETRLRMTRIPKGADLIVNKVSGAPGFWIGNVIVMAGVPSIMQAMLDEVAPKLKIGIRMFSETVRADVREGDIGMQLGEIAKANPGVAIAGKLVATAWLGQHWHAAPLLLRIVLIAMVAVLMGLNAVGVFGFLTRAHLDHMVTVNLALADRTAEIEARLAVQAQIVGDLDRRIAQIDAAIEESTRRGRPAGAMALADQTRRDRADLAAARQRETSY
jgi:molybdopterin-biosynthesis enzyme MoeA-like protein